MIGLDYSNQSCILSLFGGIVTCLCVLLYNADLNPIVSAEGFQLEGTYLKEPHH